MPKESLPIPSKEPRTQLPPVQSGPTIRIGDEFGTAKRNLPPIRIVALTLAGVFAVAALLAFLQRAEPKAAGSIESINAVEIPGQSACLVALTFILHNSPEKPLWVKNIQGNLLTSSGEQTADAISAVDFDRYYGAFPALRANAQPALSPEDKLQPGQQVQRTILVSFPVSIAAFSQRKSVNVIIQPYDQPLAITLTK